MTDGERSELEQLREQLKVVEGVVNAVPAMLAYWDTAQRCVFANLAYLRWFGVSPEWMVGRTLADLLGSIYPLNQPYIEGALRGEAQAFEREIPDPQGGPPRHAHADYLPDVAGGVVKGFYVLVTDITQRKLMEEQLRSAQRSAEEALAQIKTLKGLLPICAWCGKIRNEHNAWETLQDYVVAHTEAKVTHSLCDSCADSKFPR
jgi:PAS domain S-box-containing protein